MCHSFYRYLTLLIGICVLLRTQAAPLSSNQTLSLAIETSLEPWPEVELSRRFPGRSTRSSRNKAAKLPAIKQPAEKRPTKKPAKKRPTKKPAKKRPTKKPAKKRPTKKPAKKRPTKKPAKKRPTKKNSTKGKSLQSNRKSPARPHRSAKSQAFSKTSSPEATATVKALPYTRPKRPTTAYNVCTIPGFECLTEYDDIANDLKLLPGREDSTTRFGSRDLALVERAIYIPRPGESRVYKIHFAANDVLTIQSKPYWTSLELFSTSGLNLPRVYADYASSDIRNPHVSLFKEPQKRNGQATVYVTEHIVELQSIPRFIETVTKTPNRNRDSEPIRLSKTVGKEFFKKQFKKYYPARVRDRPIKPNGQKPADPVNRSVMDNVFEALGSKENAEDFVLCETGINSVKQKLWTNFDPAHDETTARGARDAADGSIPSNEHFSTFRVVLAVFEYMEAVEDRLQNEIQNVKTEFSAQNIRSIVKNEEDMPQDEHGNVVDLGPLWQEYMQKLLVRLERRGVDWLNKQIKDALHSYEAELQRLREYSKRFKKEEAEPNRVKRLKLINERVEEGNTHKERLKELEKKLTAAKKDQKVKSDKVNALLAQIMAHKDKAKQKEKKKELKYKGFKDADSKAIRDLYKAQKEVGLMRRKIDQSDEKLFKRLIKDVEDDVAQLKAYQKVVKTRESKLEDEEMRLKMKYLVL